jgi:nucleoside-diphosphate-sugar epimerase
MGGSRMARALVTGGSGYFGEILIQILLEKGWEVFNLDLNVNSGLPLEKQFIGDIRNPELCSKATQGIDVVFHNVAQVPLAKDNELFLSVNIDGTRNILDAASDSGVSQYIYTSSSAVFGLPSQLPITSSSLPLPIEKYGEAKLEGEKLCLERQGSKMLIKIVRPRTILGAGRMGIFSLLDRWISEGSDIYILGNGSGPYQFVHSQDLAEGIVRSVSIESDCILNLGASSFGSFRDDLKALCDYSKTGSKVRTLPEFPFRVILQTLSRFRLLPFAPYQLLLYGKPMYFDSTEDWNRLGYQPKYSNFQCLVDGYDWYLTNATTKSDVEVSAHKSSLKGVALDLLSLFLKALKKITD